MKTHKLWKDVPAEERADEAFLLTLGGGSDPYWMKRRLDVLAHPKCAAACRYENVQVKYHPCSRKPVEGETFCWVHGGKAKPKLPPKKLRVYKVGLVEVQSRFRRVTLLVESKSKYQATFTALTLAKESQDWGKWEEKPGEIQVRWSEPSED